jgi:hypothetical protein
LVTGTGLIQALMALFLYLIPAVSLHLLVGGLANPRAEGWEPTERAARLKAPYLRFAQYGRQLNLLLLSFFLIEMVMFLVLRSEGCDPAFSHTAAAAHNIARIVDTAFALGFLILVLGAIAAIAWSIHYHMEARKNGWADPRRRDHLIVHIVLVPLSLLLLYVSFGVLPGFLCPGL